MQILGLHIIEGAVKAADLEGVTEVTTMEGFKLLVSTAGGVVTFTASDGGSVGTVVEADIMSCAGVVHKIDMVLMPGNPEEDDEEDVMDEVVEEMPGTPEEDDEEEGMDEVDEEVGKEEEKCPSILELAAGSEDLSTLAVALNVCFSHYFFFQSCASCLYPTLKRFGF